MLKFQNGNMKWKWRKSVVIHIFCDVIPQGLVIDLSHQVWAFETGSYFFYSIYNIKFES